MNTPNQLENNLNRIAPQTPPSVIQRPQRTWAIILALLMVAGLSVGSVWAYKHYSEPPEKKLAVALERMAAANSFAFTGTVSVTPSPDSVYGNYLNMAVPQTGDQRMAQVEMRFNGAWEGRTKENNKWMSSFLIAAPAAQNMAVGFELRSVRNKLYAQLSNDTKVPFDISAFTNIWVALDIAGSLRQFGLNPAQFISSTANDSFVSDISNEKVKEMVRNANLFTIHSVSDRKIDGQSFVVFNVTLQKENLRKLFLDLAALENNSITEKQKNSFEQGLAELQAVSGDIIITKKDSVLHQMLFEITSTKQEKIKIDVLFADFNKPVAVAEPEQAMPLEELIGQLLGGLGQNFNTSFQASPKSDADEDGLPDNVEVMYGTDPGKADTDGDGISDYDEVAKNKNPNGGSEMPTSF